MNNQIKPIKETQMENKDGQVWDELLNSKEGSNAFEKLMKEAKKEVSEGKAEDM